MTEKTSKDVRSWSQLTVKSVDEDERLIRGIASTPTTDRVGDIVEPKGAQFKLPLPFLDGHKHEYPIGHVESAVVTEKGIEIVARIAKDSGLEYVERAWKQLKAGLVRGLSIGFRGLKAEPIERGGLRYKAYELFEISAVVVPANADATITAIKKFDPAVQSSDGGSESTTSGAAPSEATVSAIQRAKHAVLAAKRTLRN